MRITCFYDHSYNIGYIYLQPPAVDKNDTETENELFEHINSNQISIPYLTDTNIALLLNQMRIEANTFEDVFKPENVIYKLTYEEDAFVVVQLVESEEVGYIYTNIDDKHPIAFFKALISARDDIYSSEYLLKPEFVMQKDKLFKGEL